MPKKIASSPRAPLRSPNAALSKKADLIVDELLQRLADTPTLTAAGILANMLPDTEDPATRLAIMRTRIKVLRTRTTACQLGQPVFDSITLGEVFTNQASANQQVSAQAPVPSGAEEKQKADTVTDPEPADKPTKIRLLKTYVHEGIELPEGGVFLVTAKSAIDLADRGLCEVLDEAETPDTDTAEDTDTNTATATAETDTAEDPETVK